MSHKRYYTGSTFEADFLYKQGDPRGTKLNHNEAEHQLGLEQLQAQERIWKGGFSLKRAIKDLLAGKGCGYTEAEQSDPPAALANDVHAHVVKKLGVEDYGYDCVKFLPCINSIVDKKGIDLIVLFQDPHSGLEHFVTVDLSVSERKRDEGKYKADVLITDEGAESKDITVYNYLDETDDLLDKEEDQQLRQARREAMAEVIVLALQNVMNTTEVIKIDEGRKNVRRKTKRLISRK